MLSSLSLFSCFDKLSSYLLPYLCRVGYCDSNRRSLHSLSEYPRKMKPDGNPVRMVESRYSQHCKHVPWYTDWNFSIKASNGFNEIYPTLLWAVKFISYISKHWMDIESLWRDISNTFSQVFEKGKLHNMQQLIVLIQIAMDMHIALRKLKMTLLIRGMSS